MDPRVTIEQTGGACESEGAQLERISPPNCAPVWYRLTVSCASVEFSVNPSVRVMDWKWIHDGWRLDNSRGGSYTRLSNEAQAALRFRRHEAIMHLVEVLKDEASMRRDVAEMLAQALVAAQRGVKRAQAELEYAEYSLERYIESLQTTSGTGESLQRSSSVDR